MYMQPKALKRVNHGPFIGDHDKLKQDGPNSLHSLERDFFQRYILSCLTNHHEKTEESLRRVQYGFFDHEEAQLIASSMADSSFGDWAKNVLECHQTKEPNVVGVSLLHAGQVLPALAISMIARRLWPQTLIVWGGPHISGLGKKAIEADLADRAFAADIFVTGHAERTFTGILDQVSSGKYSLGSSTPMVLDGFSSKEPISPLFSNLDLYDPPLTLPAQSSVGCAYGRCRFCTYPAIEPKPSRFNLDKSIGGVVDLASELGASVSIKDSLATTTRLLEIGDHIADKVPWSACTKLSSRLDRDVLAKLQRGGLATLEVGLESLLEETQKRIDKIQSVALFESFVSDVATTPDLTLIVNYMVGFPWEDEHLAQAKMHEAQSILDKYLGKGRVQIELNLFELERLATMAKFPELYGIESIRAWPWASVLEYTPKSQIIP
jgi:radical SAM superfamily enzyme YgiQ (UPF0313 family)